MIDGASPIPPLVSLVMREAAEVGLLSGCDARVGAMLRTLAVSKPGGRLLELGTGVGLGTAWLLDGMDQGTRLTTVDVVDVGGIARHCLGHDPRVEFVERDGAEFLSHLGPRRFDLVFADAPPGKHHDVGLSLDALAPGGLWVADDMFPDPAVPGRAALFDRLLEDLTRREDLVLTDLPWATGVVVAARRP